MQPFQILSIFFLGEVVALKKLKMEKEKEGFPITSLREINTLLKSHHPNIINVRVSLSTVCMTCTSAVLRVGLV